MSSRLPALRGAISTALLVMFALSTLTGAVLFLVPHGPASRAWALMGLTKERWRGLHRMTSLAFVALSLLHLAVNLRMYVAEVRALFRPKAR